MTMQQVTVHCPSLEAAILELVRISLQREHECSRLRRELHEALGLSGPDTCCRPLSEGYELKQQMEANLGHQAGDPRHALMMRLPDTDVRRMEVLTYVGARNWSLEDAVDSVPQESKPLTISHLLNTKLLQRDLVMGWAEAIRRGVWHLEEWDPDGDPDEQHDWP